MSALLPHTIPSLIQGISQQAEASRGLASAKDQENCINSVLDGVVSRMGSRVSYAFEGSYSDPWCYVIERETDEAYLVVVEGTSLRVFNLIDGTEAEVTGDISSYLTHLGKSRRAFAAATVEDTTFLVNRQVVAAMDSVTTTARSDHAIAFFKAGSYSTWYTLTIGIVGGSSYSASYQTPDNSTPGNAEFIDTSYLAEEFKDAFDAVIAPALASAGHGTFTCARNGSTLRIAGPGTVTWWIDTLDGQGDRQFISFKEKVRSIADLPVRCFEGYRVAVAGDNREIEDDYFLEFVGKSPSGGVWEEITAWGTEYQLDEDTMPMTLVNTGVDTFDVGPAPWGIRVSGDGLVTSVDPNFVGKNILDIQFFAGRLAVLSSGSLMMSQAGNAYTFFPDTAQAELDTDPLGFDIANGSVTLLKRGSVAGERLQLWGSTVQLMADSGQDPLRADTTEIKPMSAFRYDGEVEPRPVGLNSLIFATQAGRWSRVIEVMFRSGRSAGQIELTAHCPRLIEGGIRSLSAAEDVSKAVVLAEGFSDRLFLYEWYNTADERIQSAWNKWMLPAPSKVLWAGLVAGEMHLLLQWPDNRVTIEAVSLDSRGDEITQDFPIRLDHRVSEAEAEQDEETGHWTLTLPYAVPSAKRDDFVCVERLDVVDDTQRGRRLPFEWVSDTEVTVQDTREDLKFFFGRIPVARRVMSKPVLQTEAGPVLADRLVVVDMVTAHEGTVEYDVEVTRIGTDETKLEPFVSRRLGDPSVLNREVKLDNGIHKASIGENASEVEIALVNRSLFPAKWTSAEVRYRLTTRTA